MHNTAGLRYKWGLRERSTMAKKIDPLNKKLERMLEQMRQQPAGTATAA
jgi:hypothetical protein